jgi:hypothetical protein
MDESETDEEFQDKDDDFEMGGGCHAAQPETGTLAYLRTSLKLSCSPLSTCSTAPFQTQSPFKVRMVWLELKNFKLTRKLPGPSVSRLW